VILSKFKIIRTKRSVIMPNMVPLGKPVMAQKLKGWKKTKVPSPHSLGLRVGHGFDPAMTFPWPTFVPPSYKIIPDQIFNWPFYPFGTTTTKGWRRSKTITMLCFTTGHLEQCELSSTEQRQQSLVRSSKP